MSRDLDKHNKWSKEYARKHPEQRKATTARYRKNHKSEIKVKNKAYSEIHGKENGKNYRRRLRAAVIAFLGGRCANPNCRWLNEDGTLGCKDERLLHVDHPKRNGSKERKIFKNSYEIYKKVLISKPNEYRLLCACCNWLFRYIDL